MNELTTFFMLAFSTLFTRTNPIGLTPVDLSMVEQFGKKEGELFSREHHSIIYTRYIFSISEGVVSKKEFTLKAFLVILFM